MAVQTLDDIKTAPLAEICLRYKVKHLYVFGSLVSGDIREDSDLDFLVDFERSQSTDAFNQFMGLKEELETLYGRQVDLLTSRVFRNPVFQEEVERTKELIYAA